MKKLALLIGIIFFNNLFSAAAEDAHSAQPSQKALMPAEKKPETILDIPDDVIGAIFFLPAKDQEALRRTNGRFRHVPTIDVVFDMASIQPDETPQVAEFLRARANVRTLAIIGSYSSRLSVPLLEMIRDLRPNLRSLNVSVCYLETEHVDVISQMINLTTLNIGSNQIGDAGAGFISRLTNLTTLNIWDNQIGAEGAASISHMGGLTFLDIWYNRIGAAGAASISQLRNLTDLNIEANQIGEAGAASISQLRNLTTLHIEANQIGAAGAASISQLRNLTDLNIKDNEIGDAGKDLLRQALPNTDIRF